MLALPENQQLIYKQFAVTFANLGHAYAEKGSRLVDSDRAAAPTYFAKAIKVLQTAKQNTRFFRRGYDEAVHDLLLHGPSRIQAVSDDEAAVA